MNKKSGLQASIKIGMFFCAALILFAVMIFKIKDFDPFETGNTFEAVFDSIYGIESGGLVKMGGVPIGEVRRLGFDNGRVRIMMFIDKEAPIKKDSVASIKMDNLFGGYFISVTPGSPGLSVVYGGELETEEIMQPSDVIDEVGRISQQVGDLLESFDRTQQELMGEITTLVKENSDKLDKTVDNIHKASENIAITVESIRDIVHKIEEGEGTVGKLIQEEEVYNKIDDITDDLQKLSRDTREMVERNEERIDNLIKNIDESAESVRDITEQIQSGEGTVGTLIYDEEVAQQTREVLDSFSQPARLKVILGFDPYYDSEQGADFEAYLKLEPRPSKYYMVRVANISASEDDEEEDLDEEEEEDLEVDIVIAYKFFNNHLVLRGGAIKSTGGFGLDYEALDGDFTLGASVYDFSKNPTAIDIRLDYFFFNGFFIKGELVDFTDNAEVRAGLGFEFEDKDLRYLIGLFGLR
jgi:phospholipid/cholesterol/gamma-HCH transport system substrate-binding protein